MIVWAGHRPSLSIRMLQLSPFYLPGPARLTLHFFQSCIILGEASRGPGNEASMYEGQRSAKVQKWSVTGHCRPVTVFSATINFSAAVYNFSMFC